MAGEYVAFRMKKTTAEAVVKSYRELEAKLKAVGYSHGTLLPRFFGDIERFIRKNSYNLDTTKK